MKLDDLDLVAENEAGFEIEAVPGVFLTVIGPYSRQARLSDIAYFKRVENLNSDGVSETEFAQKADLYSVSRAASRITGWRGIDEPYTPELATRLCEINPVIRLAVISESEKLENFMRSK